MTRLSSIAIVCFFLLGLLLGNVNQARAGQLLSSSATHKDGVYTLLLEARLDGEANAIRALLADFGRMGEYNETITESAPLASPAPGVQRGRLVAHDCVAMFCKDLVQVQELRQLPNGDLQVTILPELSDYRMGHSLWHIEELANGETLLRVEAQMAPRAWVPPLVGTSMVANLLRKRAITMVENLESLAQRQVVAQVRF